MRCCFLAALMLVGLGAGRLCADYLQILVDVRNATPFVPTGGGPGTPGGQGGFSQPGAMAQPPPPVLTPDKKGPRPPPTMRKAPATQQMPLPGSPPPTLPPGALEYPDPLWAIVYLEIKGKPQNLGPAVEIDHQFGRKTYIPRLNWKQGDPPQFLYIETITKDSPAIEYGRRANKLKDTADTKALLNLAVWAWSHGLLEKFHLTMGDLKKVNGKHPAVVAYDQIQKQLKAPLAEDDHALKGLLDELRGENYRSVIADKGHYALYTNLTPTPAHDAQLKRRLLRLEEAMESFYYWFALQDKMPIPPMPRHRLLGVLINEPEEYHRKLKSWGPEPMPGEGFTPRRDNIMVLSAKRLDEAYVFLEQKNNEWRQRIKAAPDDLLNGTIWKRSDAAGPNAMPYAIIQTMSVVQKALEDETERNTLSHEAIRQLLAASGLLPRNVAAPEWIREGLAGYFERPLGAVYGGGGLPSWSNLVAFKYHKAHDLGKTRDVLLNVITDRYFQIARTGSLGLDGTPERPTDKTRDDWERARATSWALVYYLIKEQKSDGLLGYIREMGQLPRDLDLGGRTLEATFARAFALSDSKNPLALESSRLQVFADQWMEYMKTVNLELSDVEHARLEFRENMAAPQQKKGGPPPKGPQTPASPPPPPPPPAN